MEPGQFLWVSENVSLLAFPNQKNTEWTSVQHSSVSGAWRCEVASCKKPAVGDSALLQDAAGTGMLQCRNSFGTAGLEAWSAMGHAALWGLQLAVEQGMAVLAAGKVAGTAERGQQLGSGSWKSQVLEAVDRTTAAAAVGGGGGASADWGEGPGCHSGVGCIPAA